MRDVRRNGGGRGLCEGPGKRVDGVFHGRSQSFWHQRRPVDDCSPGRGGMAQNGRTFHGEMDRCRKNQGWTTACSGMPERDGKNQEEDIPKQVLVRSPLLTSHKWRELVSSGRLVCRCHGVFSLMLRLFLFCFVFRLYAFVEAATLRSIVLRYAGVPIATRVSFFLFFLFFCLFGDVAFSEYLFLYHLRFLFVWRVRRTFFPSGRCFFYLVTTGWIFDISLCENSINQSIK